MNRPLRVLRRRRGGFRLLRRCAVDDDPRREITVVEIRVRFLERRHRLIDLVTESASDIRNQVNGRELRRFNF